MDRAKGAEDAAERLRPDPGVFARKRNNFGPGHETSQGITFVRFKVGKFVREDRLVNLARIHGAGEAVTGLGVAEDAGESREDGDVLIGRGRQADTPSEIPARGWWNIIKRAARQVSEDRVMAEAAGVTYYALLALFPALAALGSVRN